MRKRPGEHAGADEKGHHDDHATPAERRVGLGVVARDRVDQRRPDEGVQLGDGVQPAHDGSAAVIRAGSTVPGSGRGSAPSPATAASTAAS